MYMHMHKMVYTNVLKYEFSKHLERIDEISISTSFKIEFALGLESLERGVLFCLDTYKNRLTYFESRYIILLY